jgi:cell division protein FtsB
MSDSDPSPFKLNRGRILILVLGALVVVIAISTWFGGINAYQALREANAEATSSAPAVQ